MDYKYKNVLVVDDNQIDLYIAEMVMATTRFAEKVTCVSSAKEALAYLKSSNIPAAISLLRPLSSNPKVATYREQAIALLNSAGTNLHISARAYMRTIKVARTIADLGGSSKITAGHISDALAYRRPSTEE